MKKPLRIGVAGVGFGALVHIPAFQSEGLEVVAVSARRQARADEAARNFGAASAFDSFEAMLASDGLDAVSIVTPPAEHLPMVLAALAAGKHVLCEKPFALNAAEALQMRDAARASGLTTMVAHEFRFASARMRAKELIGEGAIGAPKFARAVMAGDAFGGRSPPAQPPPFNPARDLAERGAGMLFALGSHYIDGLIHWFGPVARVSAELTTLTPERLDGERTVKADADDLYLLQLTFRSGVLAELVGSMRLPFGPGATIEVYGADGTIVTPQGRGWNPPAHGKLLIGRLGDKSLKSARIPRRLAPFRDDRDDRLMPFRLLVRQFLAGIEAGASPAPNFDDAYHCQQVLDAARESSRTGRRIEIAA
jgi:predicted dehydrogenase